jgi:phage/plasmid-associated DNA primase
MSNYNGILKILKNDKINTPVFTVYNFATNKKNSVDINNVISFYKMYCDSVYCKDMINWNVGPILSLGELAGDTLPVISEFVFRFQNASKNYQDDNFYNRKLIHGIINCHQEAINELIFVSARQNEYICLVMESKPWQEQNNLYVRLKFQFPFCRIGKRFLSTIFRNKLISKLREEKIQKYFTNSTPIGDWSEHLQSIPDIYPLYGSTSNSKKPPVLFTGVYGEYEDGFCREMAIQNTYSFRNHSFIANENCIIEEVETLCEDDGENDYELSIMLLPMFMSLHFCTSVSRLKEHSLDIKDASGSSLASEKEEDEDELNSTDLEIILEMLDILSEQRFNNENYFLDIGRALYHTTEGADEGLKIWARYAEEKSDNFDKRYCCTKYESFDEDKITVKTLGWYARQDDEDRYKIWHNKWCMPKLKECIEQNFAHVLVAEAFYRFFWLDYMYTGKHWARFEKSRLVLFRDDIPIKRAITDKFVPCFITIQYQLSLKHIEISKNDKVKNGAVKEATKEIQKNQDKISKAINKLLNESFRGLLVKSIKDYFWRENLSKILDSSPYLLGVKNCVIELNDKKAFIRPGKPEDYITKKVGVSYRYDYSFKHQDVKDLLLYFRQVFPEKSLNHHMKKDIASMLYGRNAEKFFRVWIGDTNGSKSVFQKMLRTMMGDYYCDLPPEFYSTQQKSGSGPNPELAQAKNSRLAFSAEPDENTQLCGALIKRITGGDSFFARGCNEDGGSFETSFKATMVLNVVPPISGLDEATRRRVAMIPFEGRWLKPDEHDDLPDDIEEQIKLKTYKMDDRFEENIPRLAAALLWLAVQNYKTYREEGLVLPPYVNKWMKQYWDNHEPLSAFIAENLENPVISKECDHCKLIAHKDSCSKCAGKGIIEIIDINKSITMTEIFAEYKRWHKEIYPDSKTGVNQKTLLTRLSAKDKLGKQKNRRWWGVILRKPSAAMLENNT